MKKRMFAMCLLVCLLVTGIAFAGYTYLCDRDGGDITPGKWRDTDTVLRSWVEHESDGYYRYFEIETIREDHCSKGHLVILKGTKVIRATSFVITIELKNGSSTKIRLSSRNCFLPDSSF